MPKPAPTLTNASRTSVDQCFHRQTRHSSPAFFWDTDWRWLSLLESSLAAAPRARNLGASEHSFAGSERKLLSWYDQGTFAAVNPTKLGSIHMLWITPNKLYWCCSLYIFIQPPQRRLERQGMQKANLDTFHSRDTHVYKIRSVSGNTKKCTGVGHAQEVMTEKELHSFLTNCMLVQNTSVCERPTLVAVKKT